MKLTESPRERLYRVTLGLAAHRSLPNILLGAFLTSLIQLVVGMVPWVFVAVSGVLWVLSVLLYAVADEFKAFIDEKRDRENNPWILSDDPEPKGIE